MGVIYKLTSPSRKSYVGQTIKTAEKRWLEHVEDAFNPLKDHCKALNEAIRKYGKDAFTIETLYVCDDDLLLDYLEIEFINELNTLTPFGYNIKLGGSSGLHAEETKQKISNSLKGRVISEETKHKMMTTKKASSLPMYLIELYKNNNLIGYRVCNHPKGPEKRFFNSKLEMKQNLQKALDYLNYLNKLDTPVSVEKRTIPKYVQKHQFGYCVRYPGEKEKTFYFKTMTDEHKLKLAIEHLNTIKEKVQRLNDDG